MLFSFAKSASLALSVSAVVGAFPQLDPKSFPKLDPRQLPAPVTGQKTIYSPGGATVRYKEPGKAGVCETTKGVNSYSGYIDLAPDAHTFFWFFEARHDPANKPLTLWLNGGPGSDSLIGLFQELGPCNVTKNLTTEVNPYSWSEKSNMLFLSQPLGTGFSYQQEAPGSINPFTGEDENSTFGPVDGRYPVADASILDTTELAAVAAWHVLQAFLTALPSLDNRVEGEEEKPKTFNFFTESYGGHYGPVFYDYFYNQNNAISNGTSKGVKLNFDTLGIINGIIDETIQAPYYPEFAVHNTYGIQAVNQTVYEYMKFACFMSNGCLDQVDYCRQANRSTAVGKDICAEAANMCRDNVEGPYYAYGGRGVYDIRHPYNDPTPYRYFVDFLNTATAQQAIGVDLNYTESYAAIAYAFQAAGDFVYPIFKTDLERILDNGVRVALIYGDADYICNWFGGQAVSLALQYPHTKEFNAAGYAPFVVDGTEYGEVRQYGQLSFLRMYEAGHEVPFYQPVGALAAFDRVINHLILADGSKPLTGTYSTNGTANATHTEPFVPLPSTTAAASATGGTGGNSTEQQTTSAAFYAA